jgi:hypothetical protein
MPREFSAAIEYGINSLLRRACSSDDLDDERISAYLREAMLSNVTLDKTTLEYSLRGRTERLAARFSADPVNLEKMEDLKNALEIIRKMPFPVDLWSAQNHVYAIQDGLYGRMRRRSSRGDHRAKAWVETYQQLSDLLSIRLPAN